MSRSILACAVVATSLTLLAPVASAVTQWSFNDGTLQAWGPSFGTPFNNVVNGPVGTTDGSGAYNFNPPPGFTYGAESLIYAAESGQQVTPDDDRIWDNFVASNLLLMDLSVTGSGVAPEGSPAQGQYLAAYPALNGPGPASGRPPGTFTFINSFNNPQTDLGQRAEYQLVFSPGYYEGVRTKTLAWDYVAAGYDFSLLVPTPTDQNFTKVHLSTNTDSGNPYAGRMSMDNIRVYRAKTTDPTYTGPATAGTFAPANFANGFASGIGAIAIFKKIDDADAATVDVTTATTVGTLMLNNAPRNALGTVIDSTQSDLGEVIPLEATSYTFGGTATLTIDNGANEGAIVAVDGDNAITAPLAFNSDAVIDLAADASRGGVPRAPASLAISNATLAAGKTLRTTSVGTLTINGNLIGGAGSTLAVNGGTAVLAGNGRRISVGNLTVGGSARLDVTANAITVDYTGASPLADLTAAIVASRIGSSTATSGQAVGIIEASAVPSIGTSFLGQTIDATTVLLRLTFKGDTDLNGTVGFSDLVSLAQSYNLMTGARWNQGDSNYDGAVNFTDLVALAQNYNQSLTAPQLDVLGSDFAADFALAQSLVPEPTTLAGLGAAALMFGRRRR